MNQGSKIYVAGHTGLLGSAVLRKLQADGYTNILMQTRKELNLTRQQSVNQWFLEHRPEYVFLCAAQVFGIGANVSGEVIYNNLSIEVNVIDAAYNNGCKKILFPGSNCAYPKFPQLPITEDQLLTGPLEPTSESYGTAKIAGIMMCKHYRKQYGFNAISVMPCNLYGPNDTFDLEHAHVMPSMINKFVTAKKNNQPAVMLWGDGSVKREFLHSDDAAEALIFCMINYDEVDIINVSSGHEIPLKDLAEMIKSLSGYKGEIVWDSSKPVGTPAKGLDISRLSSLGWNAKISLEKGIQDTIDWFEKI